MLQVDTLRPAQYYVISHWSGISQFSRSTAKLLISFTTAQVIALGVAFNDLSQSQGTKFKMVRHSTQLVANLAASQRPLNPE